MEEETTTSLQQLQLKIEELHEDIQVYQHSLSHFITNHDLLDDLDMTVTQDEVDRLIAYENGEAIRLTIQKLDNTTFQVMVYKSATVNHLKLAIRDMIQRNLPQDKNQRVSWKYIWRKYCLQCEDGKLLLDNRNFLKDFAIHDGSILRMIVKPIKRREKKVRVPNQKKRFYNPNLHR